MIKKIFLNLSILTIYSYVNASQQLPGSNKLSTVEIDKLYEKLKQQHTNNQALVEQLNPLIKTIPTLPGTENSKKIFKEIADQTNKFTWYITYPTGWNENRQQQKWSQLELENLIALKEADHYHLQTMSNCLHRYANHLTNTAAQK